MNVGAPKVIRLFLAFGLASLLAACGGGDAQRDGVMRFAAEMSAASRAQALNASPSDAAVRKKALATASAPASSSEVSAELLLDWAEYTFASLFPMASVQKFPKIDYQGETYNARLYRGAWGDRYLGVTADGRVFGYGDFAGGGLQQYGTLADWSAQTNALRCTLYPGQCGKLVPEVRAEGLSAGALVPGDYRDVLDFVLTSMSSLTADVSTNILWPKDIPLKFAGCGTLNAFMGNFPVSVTAFEVLDFFNNATSPRDWTSTAGANFADTDMSFMCHELTEAIVKAFYVNRDAALLADYGKYFFSGSPTNQADEIKAAAGLSATVMALEVLFHELGHGVDKVLLQDDAANSKKGVANFTYPFANVCGQASCNTVTEDFADWFAMYVMAEEIRRSTIGTSAGDIKLYVGAMVVATTNWTKVFGQGGGDAVHGLTSKRQSNMACYLYGSSPEFRKADADNGGRLAGLMVAEGLNPDNCEPVYTKNADSTQRFLGPYLKF